MKMKNPIRRKSPVRGPFQFQLTRGTEVVLVRFSFHVTLKRDFGSPKVRNKKGYHGARRNGVNLVLK
jgi:hypothetical protein